MTEDETSQPSWTAEDETFQPTSRVNPASLTTPPPSQDSSQLPNAPDWLLDNIAEASKTSSRIFSIFLGLLAYCALTVVSTTDRQLLFNEPAHLPLVNVGVPLVGFFILSPLLCLLVFVYLQLYLHRIKGMISQLQAEYLPVEPRRLYPWMLTIAEDPEPGSIGTLQKGIVTVFLWWSLPVVLSLFPIWFTRRHDPFLSYMVAAIPFLGILIVVWFWNRYETERRGRMEMKALGLLSAAMLAIIPFANHGNFTITNINLPHEILVTIPDEDKNFDFIYWADLHGAHLEGAALSFSVLKRAKLDSAHLENADLYGAHLERANLNEAYLEGANLTGAHLERATLVGAILQQADLGVAYLKGASLHGTHLERTNLEGANLEDTDLDGADLEGANLDRADLKGASLDGASLLGVRGLTINRLAKVKTLYNAQLDALLLKALEKDYPDLLKKPHLTPISE